MVLICPHIIYLRIRRDRTGQEKRDLGGGGLWVESCGGWGCGEVGPDGGTTVEGSSSRNWCAQ